MEVKLGELKKALRCAVEINALDYRNKKYKYSEKWKAMLKDVVKDKSIKSVEDALVNILWKLGYFEKPRTTEETAMMVNLLILKSKR